MDMDMDMYADTDTDMDMYMDMGMEMDMDDYRIDELGRIYSTWKFVKLVIRRYERERFQINTVVKAENQKCKKAKVQKRV
jgi:hypothetical protein